MKPQCWFCVYWLFFKPLPDETFSCCAAFGENIASIDLRKGCSPMVAKYFAAEEECPRKKEGKSICETRSDSPFVIHLVRLKGENELFQRMQSEL